MKTIKFLNAAAVVALVVIGLSSCSKGDDLQNSGGSVSPFVPADPFSINQMTCTPLGGASTGTDSISTGALTVINSEIATRQALQSFNSITYTFYEFGVSAPLLRVVLPIPSQSNNNLNNVTDGVLQRRDGVSNYTSYYGVELVYGFRIPTTFRRKKVYFTSSVVSNLGADSTTNSVYTASRPKVFPELFPIR